MDIQTFIIVLLIAIGGFFIFTGKGRDGFTTDLFTTGMDRNDSPGAYGPLRAIPGKRIQQTEYKTIISLP